MATLEDELSLPSAYEKISYITADGNQSLRTTYFPEQNDEIHVRYKGQNGTLFSAGVGTYQLVLISGFSQTGWYFKYFSSATGSANFGLVTDDWYDLDINSSGTLSIDGHTLTVPYEAPLDGTTGLDLWIAERRNWSARYTGSIAEFWIKNSGKYKMYLIPCRRKSDQKIGMYDAISKTFYVSSRNDFII